MVKKLIAMAALTLVLGACSTTVGGQFCQVAKPIRPTTADTAAISDQLVNQLVAHNEKMEALCKVKP